jgi:AcrR family transcriptional regulator
MTGSETAERDAATTSGATATSPARTARERAREQITAEILEAARRHLATDGAAGLSLRAIARELGFASSAVYRYVSSRDDLLTELLVDCYGDLGASAEAAASRSVGDPPASRWVTVACTIRDWAVAHPHEWALLYGSPVPGYEAPERTIEPGIRASLALLGVVRDATRSGWRPSAATPGGGSDAEEAGTDDLELDGDLEPDLQRLGERLGLPDDLEPAALVGIVAAWTQTFGLVSFEVFGQTHGMVGSDEALFRAAAASTAAALGLDRAARERDQPRDP